MRLLTSTIHLAIFLFVATPITAVADHGNAGHPSEEIPSNSVNDLVDLTHYHVTTSVQSRLLKTTIDMTFRRLDDANFADEPAIVDVIQNSTTNAITSNTTSSSPKKQCGPVIHTMTLQLPRLARVQSLEMDLSDGCQLGSQVQGLEQAEDTFDDMVSGGRSAALLTAWDMSNYKLQIVLPAATNGNFKNVTLDGISTTNATLIEASTTTTKVRLIYTELLVQKNHRVDFQLPVFPGMAVSDSLTVDLTVEDSNAGISELKFFEDEDANGRKLLSNLDFHVNMTTAHFEEKNLPKHSSIPRLMRGYFRPASLPEEGVLTIPSLEKEKDELCFTHVFNPSTFLATAGSLPKNIVFVIDISGSMGGGRLEDAKVAFASMVSALADGRDAFSVQTFSSRGTETLWGPAMANPTSRYEATQFVKSLQTSGGTNLHDAYLDGIRNARTMVGTASAAVPILIVLSDGQASGGVTDRVAIARNVREANGEGHVKIFSLAFGSSADVDLLTGIALQNGGKVLRIYEGFDDTVIQMENFYKKELEQIVLSDIDISYFQQDGASNVGVASTASASAAVASFLPLSILDATSSSFPVLAAGSELIVRGKVSRSDLPIDSSILQASISANSAIGNQDWSHQYDVSLPGVDSGDNNAGNSPLIVNDCEQAFAHARIEELLNFHNAVPILGEDLTTSNRDSSVSSFEEQARKIAIDAQLVWPGLTALVTVENPGCQQIVPQSDRNETQVCYSGENGQESNGDSSGGYFGNMQSASSGPTSLTSSWWFITTLSSLVFMLLR